MASIYDANTNYQVTGTDLRANPGLVTREYIIDVYPTFVDNYRFAGLWSWGSNVYGQLGDNSVTSRSSPVQTVAGGTNWKQVSAGITTAAIKADGTLWLWGDNTYGQLGDNSAVAKSSPIQTVSGGTNWKQVSINYFVAAAVKIDGTLWLWGSNAQGQLGDNTTTHRSSPVQTVAGGTNWKQVSCGYYHVAAIKTDGSLWLWGYNGSGQLGDNSTVSKSSPVQTVAAGTNWKQVFAASKDAFNDITAAIKTDGTLWLWGYNVNGQLGDNSVVSKSSPVQTISAGTNWKQVSTSGQHTAAIKTDGTLWLWGSNSSGQLGNNTFNDKYSSPVQTVAGGTNWKQVVCNSDGVAAIKTDGTLWMWGLNNTGQMGTGNITSRSSPVQTIATGTNWKSVSSGGENTAAIRDDSADPFRANPL